MKTLINNLDNIINYAELSQDVGMLELVKPELQIFNEYPNELLISNQLFTFGFYLSNHPVTKYRTTKDIITTKIKEYYDVNMLISLIRHTQKRIVQFNQILSCMKEDYQAIFDRIQGRSLLLLNGSDPFKIQYIKHKCVSRLGDYGNDVSQISMAIQKSKYDGSKKAYDDFVFRLNKIDEVPDDKK